MKNTKSLWIALFLWTFLPLASHCKVTQATETKYRLIILADMGNEPDEMQQMVHLMMYNNEIDLEGLIAVTGIWLRPDFDGPAYRKRLHPELFHQIIDGYEKVYPNMKLHGEGWHSPDYLRSIVQTGQQYYGIDDVGAKKTSPGSRLITEAVLKEDPRPVYIVANAGSNTLAQALWDYREGHTAAEMDAFLSKIIVYENGAQDDAGAWILSHFPSIHWIRSTNQKNAYGGNTGLEKGYDTDELGPWAWKPYPYSVEGQHEWAGEHIQTSHGSLGETYPDRFDNDRMHFMEGGGTVPWIGLTNPGLYDPNHPSWGGYSGRYTAQRKSGVWSNYQTIIDREQKEFSGFMAFADTSDAWTDPLDGRSYENINTPVHRWRQLLFDDFKCRMDWCVLPFSEANHPPRLVINGLHTRSIHHVQARPGEKLTFNAAQSFDPDQGQRLSFSWYFYPEAGNWSGELPPLKTGAKKQRFEVPEDAGGQQIHLILDVYDNSEIAPMHDVRRIVIDVVPE